jgi:hypothetical protein
MNIKKITTKTALAIATSAMMSGSVFAACSADIDMDGNKIIGLATPTVALGAANKGYVDSQTGGTSTTINFLSTAFNTGGSGKFKYTVTDTGLDYEFELKRGNLPATFEKVFTGAGTDFDNQMSFEQSKNISCRANGSLIHGALHIESDGDIFFNMDSVINLTTNDSSNYCNGSGSLLKSAL